MILPHEQLEHLSQM